MKTNEKKVLFYFPSIFICQHLPPAVNFINILRARFSYKILSAKISNPKASFVVFGTKILYKKPVRNLLMKLTPVSETADTDVGMRKSQD